MNLLSFLVSKPKPKPAPVPLKPLISKSALSEVILNVETDPLAGKGFLKLRDIKLDRLLAHIRLAFPEFDRETIDQIMTLIEQDELIGKGYLSESDHLVDRILAKAKAIKSAKVASIPDMKPVIVLNTEAPAKGK